MSGFPQSKTMVATTSLALRLQRNRDKHSTTQQVQVVV